MNYDLAKVRLMDKGGLYSMTSDSRKIFTPFKLASEILDQIELEGDILTFNMEFIFVLKERGLINNVWFATVCDMQERAMIALGVDKSQIIRYDYNNLEDFPKMKFDVVIANPPYEKNKYVDFIRLGISLTKKGGWIGFITPRWMMLFASKWNRFREFVFSNVNVNLVKYLNIKTFNTLKNERECHILIPTHYFIGKNGGTTSSLTVKKDWQGQKYSVDLKLRNISSPIPSFVGSFGKELFEKMKDLPRANLSLEKDREFPGTPCVFAGVRHRSHLWGMTGSTNGKLISGMIIDPDGSIPNPDRGKGNKQPVWYCESPNHSHNIGVWLNSKALKYHISQVDGSSKFLNGVIKYYPDCPITDRIATEEEMYRAAGFSDELIEWINSQ